MQNSLIGLLATGDEVLTGQIINLDSKILAERLTLESFSVGNHLVASDDEKDMNICLAFLLKHHQVVITTGGLGPTSDDRTRNVISAITGKPLVFHKPSWDRIVSRLTELKLPVPENNRQQAYFPEGADIFTNDAGTADGCVIPHKNQLIFMLPGPPSECFPLFEKFVLPYLEKNLRKNPEIHQNWRLFGVSEASVAEKLDAIVSNYRARTGYRIDYPYVEFKLHVHPEENVQELFGLIDDYVKPFLLAHKEKRASEVLREKLKHFSSVLIIEDAATGGHLQTTLFHPDTCKALRFEKLNSENNDALRIKISGLEEFWRGDSGFGKTTFFITVFGNGDAKVIEKVIPFRINRVINYAVEAICNEILLAFKL